MGTPVNIPIDNQGWTLGPNSHYSQLGSVEAGSGGTFSQKLGMSPAQLQEYKPGYTIEGVYALTFSVANNFPSYPGYFTVTISFGTQELCEASGWGTRTLEQVTVTGPGPGYIVINHSLDENGNSGSVQGTSDLVITFRAGGWPLLFSNVSLTFTPQ
jgi:hypothetical protein